MNITVYLNENLFLFYTVRKNVRSIDVTFAARCSVMIGISKEGVVPSMSTFSTYV